MTTMMETAPQRRDRVNLVAARKLNAELQAEVMELRRRSGRELLDAVRHLERQRGGTPAAALALELVFQAADRLAA